MEFKATFLQLSYVVIYSVNCLKLEKSGFKFQYHFYSLQKRLKKQFFGAEYNFFANVARFARKHFLAYPKLVWTPCTYAFRDVIFEHA